MKYFIDISLSEEYINNRFKTSFTISFDTHSNMYQLFSELITPLSNFFITYISMNMLVFNFSPKINK